MGEKKKLRGFVRDLEFQLDASKMLVEHLREDLEASERKAALYLEELSKLKHLVESLKAETRKVPMLPNRCSRCSGDVKPTEKPLPSLGSLPAVFAKV